MSDIVTTATPYCSPAQLLDYVDVRIVGDCLVDREDDPRPSRAAILDATSPYGARLVNLMLAASGELEEACFGSAGYTPADLQSLTGATAASLARVVAGLTVLALFGRRQPSSSRIEDIPVAQYAQERLDKPGRGERVFGLAPALDAAQGMEPVEVVDVAVEHRTVTYAQRYFGTRAPR